MLAGKVAIVTGGARGIGRAIAERLATERAAVLIADRAGAEEAAAAIRAAGGHAFGHACDLSDATAIPRVVEAAIRELGGAQILVNNAGVEFGGGVFEVTPEVWDAHLDVNLRAAFFVSQAAARWMRDNGGGAIVNVASIQGGVFSGRFVPYTASKAGLRGLTGSLAVALAPSGIRVNAVAPGWTETAMNHAAGDAAETTARLSQIPLGRIGRPEDTAEAVAFLAGPRAAYITGQVLAVDGGRSLGMPARRS
jgi:NAD(P)-dependent dehydrogenase (short-subunit alcohol dehydrogenase family)